MKKIGTLLIILSVIFILLYLGYGYKLKQQETKEANTYIKETSIIKEETIEIDNIDESSEKKETKNTISYKAVLEIPSINLKQGVVDSTKNFSSINYAVSVDNSSDYPDKMGNFILYAHSGNSSVAYFRNLNKVKLNDTIYVYFNGIKYKYIVSNIYDIEKTGKAGVIRNVDNKVITLITCNQNKEGYQTIVIGKIESEESY